MGAVAWKLSAARNTKERQSMNVTVEKRFAVEVVYNGVAKILHVEPEERVTALLKKAIEVFGITQNPHLLSLYRGDGSAIPENESVERAGLKPGETLLLRPNAVKGGAGLLRVAENLMVTTLKTLRECGAGRWECVVYWLGPDADSIVDGVEHPIHERSPFGYVIDDTWLTGFCTRLAVLRRSVKAQVHTHPGRPFHSATDDQWPIVSQVGFLSVVIPNFAADESSLENAWVGRLQSDGKWQQLASAAEAVVVA
jgi:hypothetical protein